MDCVSCQVAQLFFYELPSHSGLSNQSFGTIPDLIEGTSKSRYSQKIVFFNYCSIASGKVEEDVVYRFFKITN